MKSKLLLSQDAILNKRCFFAKNFAVSRSKNVENKSTLIFFANLYSSKYSFLERRNLLYFFIASLFDE